MAEQQNDDAHECCYVLFIVVPVCHLGAATVGSVAPD